MKKKNKVKVSKYESSDTKEIKSLIIITLVVLVVAGLLYFLTDYINGKKVNMDTQINYDTCFVGNMFNRPYDEYYVFAYNSLDANAATYTGLITSYNEGENHKKVYHLDLNDRVNESVISNEHVKNPVKPCEGKINGSALLYIKDGKVVNYFETLEEYKSALK